MLDTRYLTRVWKNAIPAFAFFFLFFLRRGCDDNRTLGTCCSLLIGRRHAPKPTLNISFRNERGTITGFLSRPSQLGNWIKQPALFKKKKKKRKQEKREREARREELIHPSKQAAAATTKADRNRPFVAILLLAALRPVGQTITCCLQLLRGHGIYKTTTHSWDSKKSVKELFSLMHIRPSTIYILVPLTGFSFFFPSSLHFVLCVRVHACLVEKLLKEQFGVVFSLVW